MNRILNLQRMSPEQNTGMTGVISSGSSGSTCCSVSQKPTAY
jgi:hypothetical protein